MSSGSSLNELSDEQLMKLYQDGNDSAFKILYERHSPKIYGFLSKRIRQKEKVAEIYQDVFIKIHKSKHLYKQTLPLLPWIFTVTKSVMLDELRKDKNIVLVDLEEIENKPSQVTSQESAIDIAGVLNQLPQVQRQAIELRYINDSTFEEISAQLKVNPTNARQLISRGLKKMRELIGEEGKS